MWGGASEGYLIFLAQPVVTSPWASVALCYRYTSFGPDGMAEWSKAPCARQFLVDPDVMVGIMLRSSDCPAILPGLGGVPGRSVYECEGLFVALIYNSHNMYSLRLVLLVYYTPPQV